MKIKRALQFMIAALILITISPFPQSAPTLAQIEEPEITRDMPFIPGEVVIQFDETVPENQLEAKATALAGKVGAMVISQRYDMALLSLAPEADVEATAELLSAQSDVKNAEPNYIYWIPQGEAPGPPVEIPEVEHEDEEGNKTTTETSEIMPTFPNDEWNNWGNEWISHEIIWINKQSSPLVCTLDSGADHQHPDLRGRIIRGYDFINEDGTPNDDAGHGTHIAGTISAKVNNNQGPAGISNGKVLAVKVLNAQGYGTVYDIASGIIYCANNKYVKVINMSLGGAINSSTLYDILDYAIVAKGKLIVAAAGNSSSSEREYPAGWADDGWLGPGILSVAGVRSAYGTLLDLWVDTDEDGIKENDEIFNQYHCATESTNYGDWVELIAPGEGIYSATPVTYPFWYNFYYSVSPGYDWLNGTSSATAHVSGAAARVWSAFKTEENWQIHNRLINSGFLPGDFGSIAVDESVPDPSIGYGNSGYGQINDTTIKAPFCWPDDTGIFGSDDDTSGARFVNVAAAMEKSAAIAQVTDATTGLPLYGARVRAKDVNTGAIKAISKLDTKSDHRVYLINLPADTWHALQVSKSGYTYGYQTFLYTNITAGYYTFYFPGLQVGVPPKEKNYTAVANWRYGYDLDMHVWLPQGSPSGVIGPGYGYIGHPNDMGVGTTLDYPFARSYRDGGGLDWMPVEAVTIDRYPGTSLPHFLAPYPNGFYDIMLHDWSNTDALDNADPVVRIWYNGKILETLPKQDTCGTDETWYNPGWIYRDGNATTIYYYDTCGDDTLWAYANGSSTIMETFGPQKPR